MNMRMMTSAGVIRPTAKYFTFSTAANPSALAAPYTMPSMGSSNSRR